MGHSSPGHPIILAQHSAKEECAARGKGKWSTGLSSYAHLSVEELHSGFLNRLHSNRDYEAGLVNLMKERYEAELSNRYARTADLQENVKSQQEEAVKAKEELTKALTAMEKLKESFNKEHADWETEKAGLTKRAEDAEAALKPVMKLCT
ncbi:uncharacterized protein [Triticum aestivum]|uniref:uncharacterized protein n=1 Tax=Triticum aestivum TaxID=4565 RepID=UPI001D02CA50|nr:uncharacterized protein LOC123130477 [Triticum aestivum]